MLTSLLVLKKLIDPSLEEDIGVILSEIRGHILLSMVTSTQSAGPVDTLGRMRGQIMLNLRLDAESCMCLESDGSYEREASRRLTQSCVTFLRTHFGRTGREMGQRTCKELLWNPRKKQWHQDQFSNENITHQNKTLKCWICNQEDELLERNVSLFLIKNWETFKSMAKVKLNKISTIHTVSGARRIWISRSDFFFKEQKM